MLFGIVTTSYPRFPGDAAGGFVQGLGRYLEEQGHELRVVCAGETTDEHAAETRDEATQENVVRLPSPLFYQGGAPDVLASGFAHDVLRTACLAGTFSMAMFRAIGRALSGCDGLISHWLVPSSMMATLALPKLPHVAVAHSSDIHLLRRFRATALVRFLSKRARLVYTAEHLVVPGAHGVVVPMGIRVADFAVTDAERQQAKATLGATKKTVLFLGRLVRVKGLFELLEAFEQVCKTMRADLWIAGDGPLSEALSAQVQARGLPVRFFGAVGPDAKRHLLAAADVLALPSLQLPDGRTEGAPVVLWEALAAGVPVVASSVGGIEAMLGGAGLVVKGGQPKGLAEVLPEALADALLRVLTDDTLAHALRLAGRQRAQVADWSQVAPRILFPQWVSQKTQQLGLPEPSARNPAVCASKMHAAIRKPHLHKASGRYK
jgi:glycosyltransferase involved in cell wall biosynthesis